jgi:hypothetical protein
MTKEEKLEKILLFLKEATECGAIEWNPRDSCFNSEKNHYYRAYSIDKQTYFDLEISLNENLSGLRSFGNAIWIYNAGFPDGRKYIPHNQIIGEIDKLIYEKHIKPSIILKAEDDTLDKVLNGIGDKSYMRDKKLNEILEIEKDENVEKEEKEESSFLKKLFGKIW